MSIQYAHAHAHSLHSPCSSDGVEDSGKTTVVTGWAAVARNEPNRETVAATEAAVTAPAVVAPDVTAPAVAAKDNDAAAAAAAAEATAQETGWVAPPQITAGPMLAPPPVLLPEPEPAPAVEVGNADRAVEQQSSSAPKSWAQMAKSRASAPVKPVATSKPSGQQVLSAAGSKPMDTNIAHPSKNKTADSGRGSDSIDMWNQGEETMPRMKPANAPRSSKNALGEEGAQPTSPVRKSWAEMAKAKETEKINGE